MSYMPRKNWSHKLQGASVMITSSDPSLPTGRKPVYITEDRQLGIKFDKKFHGFMTEGQFWNIGALWDDVQLPAGYVSTLRNRAFFALTVVEATKIRMGL
jgi:hypothetical protein